MEISGYWQFRVKSVDLYDTIIVQRLVTLIANVGNKIMVVCIRLTYELCCMVLRIGISLGLNQSYALGFPGFSLLSECCR